MAGFRFGLVETPDALLQRYQIGKLHLWASAGDAESPIVFLGDSSLGNSVDAQVVEEITGRPVLNLALSGSYGYAGTYNMLRRLVEVRKPHLVVIMHTVDMMTRKVSDLGDIYTAPDLPVMRVSPKSLVKAYLNLTNLLSIGRGILGLTTSDGENLLAGDYIRQNAIPYAETEQARFRPLDAGSVRPEKLRYLQRIEALCRSRQLRCLYAHGPIHDRYCEEWSEYIRAASERIRETGLPLLASTPVCTPREDLGDTEDHIAPRLKRAYTWLFLERLLAEVGTVPVEALR